ncbi:hypothetical protein V8D89_004926, partial [Ganoderma adspersum]
RARAKLERAAHRGASRTSVPTSTAPTSASSSTPSLSISSIGTMGYPLRVLSATVRTTSHFRVVADGAHSCPVPTFTFYATSISLAPEVAKLPKLAETVENFGQSTLMAMEDSRMLCAQICDGDGRLRAYALPRKSESWAISGFSDPTEAKAVLRGNLGRGASSYSTSDPHSLWWIGCSDPM